MFVFGGCTRGNTTFNDLWTFDLERRCWIRPLISGTHPPPKACASLVRYKRKLILFGGWTHSAPYPLDHLWKLFNQMHEFDLEHNRWSCVTTSGDCPPMAGHSATVRNDSMLVFGGLCASAGSYNNYEATNNLWIFDFVTCEWSKKLVSGYQPPPRYGHSQILLDQQHLLVMGGCSGPKVPLNDVWMLLMTNAAWEWRKVQVLGKDMHTFPLFGFNPVVRVENTLAFLTKSPHHIAFENQFKLLTAKRDSSSFDMSIRPGSLHNRSERNVRAVAAAAAAALEKLASGSVSGRLPPSSFGDRDVHHLNGASGKAFPKELKHHSGHEASGSGDESSNKTGNPACAAIHLDTIRNESLHRSLNPMQLHLLDISRVREEAVIDWLSQNRNSDGPGELIHYSLIAATNELIMFGGLSQALPEPFSEQTNDNVFKSVYIGSAKLNVI